MGKKVLISILSILVMIGIVVGIKAWYLYKTTEVIQEKVEIMSTFDVAAITRIEIRDDKTFKYKKEQGVWSNEAYPSLRYNQEKMQILLKEISEIVANETIRNVQDLGQYGINEYARLITVYNEEEKQDIVIGAYIADKESYYVWNPKEEILGVVPKETIEMLISEVGTWIEDTVWVPKWEDVNHLVVGNGKESILDVAKKDDIWRVQQKKAWGYPVKTEEVEAYIEELAGLTKQSFVGEVARHGEKYGLNEPTLVISLNEEWTVRFGKHKDNKVYFTYGDEGFIYEGDTQSMEKLHKPEVVEWLTGTIPVPPLEMLEKIEMSYQDKAVTVVLEEALTEHQQAFVAAVTNLQIHAPLAQANLENISPREAELTIKYYKKDGTESILEMIPYDPSFYLLRQEGYVNFSVAKQPLIDYMKLIEEGIR